LLIQVGKRKGYNWEKQYKKQIKQEKSPIILPLEERKATQECNAVTG